MIFHIEGPAKSGKSTVADAIRNSQIAQGRGALLADEQTDGEPIPLLEKLIAGDALEPGTAASKIKWKKQGAVILVGAKVVMLDEFEALAPGFAKQFGPVVSLKTSIRK